MRLLNVILIMQIFSEGWRYVGAQDEPKFSQTSCTDDPGCNRNRPVSGYQCSVCAEDKSGVRRCLATFLDGLWFNDQCSIPTACKLSCKSGKCINDDEKYLPSCLCPSDYYGQLCNFESKDDSDHYTMVQWFRANAFAKPGEVTRFHFRAVGESSVVANGVIKMAKTGLGNIVDLGEKGKKGPSSPENCEYGICSEEYFDLQLPFLLPENDYNVTVLKIKDKLKGYSSAIDVTFLLSRTILTSSFAVFVNYEHALALKCIAMIRLTNCARSYDTSSKFTFRRNENIVINHNVKYLEDGAYLSTAKENRQTCTDKDVTWIWSWSKALRVLTRKKEYQQLLTGLNTQSTILPEQPEPSFKLLLFRVTGQLWGAIEADVKEMLLKFGGTPRYLVTAHQKRCRAKTVIRRNFFGEIQNEGSAIGHLLMFKKFTLDFGKYRVNLRIKRVISAATNENFDECYFDVKPLPLKAIIDRGEVRNIIKDTGVSLTASQSYDPNQSADNQNSLKIKWLCECLSKQIPNCENSCKKKYKWISVNQVFFVPGSELQYNAEYKFTLTVDSTIKYRDKAIAPQFSHVTIKVANESVKMVTNYYIKCIQNCVKEATFPNEVLFLKVEVSVSGNSSPKINEAGEFDWVYSKEADPVLNPVDSLRISELPTNMLAIKEDSFDAGATYTIRLREHNSQEIAAEYSFKTESVKYEGNCRVEPQSGVKGFSRFDIICEGFEGLIYEFYDKNEEDLAEKVAFNGRMLGTSEFLGALHDLRITRGNIEVYIIQKDSKLFVKKSLKVELSPWNVNDAIMEEIKKNLTSTARLHDLKTTMNYISFIPDILPESEDKGQILDLLLEPISQASLITLADAKLSASTMKIVLQTLNKIPNKVDFGLIWKILVIIKRHNDIIGKAVKNRHTSQWMSSKEIRLVAVALLECLNSILRSQSASSAGLSEERMGFDSLFMLRKNAQKIGEILDTFKDILCYIQAPGLPPAKLATSDKSFKIWAMGNVEDYPVSEMLKKDDNIPFGVSQHLLETFSVDSKYETDLFFQVALIEKNMFSWSKSDVKSKLVSLSVAIRKKDEDLKKVKLLTSPIIVRIAMENNLTNTVVRGSALQLDPKKLDPTVLDLKVKVHRIDTPPKGFVTIRFLFPPTTESLRVLVKENFRPDYEMMTDPHNTVIINSSNPEYPLKHHQFDVPIFLYMGVLPGKNVAVNKTVDYEFEVTQNLCQLWIEGQWSSIDCVVSEATTANETVCACEHLSIFAAAFPVPPQSIDPFGDAKLFLTVLDNPLVVVFVTILFIIYLMLVLWGRYKDSVDRYKGNVVVLADNFPEDEFPYMVAVHTSARFNSGTTAHVGIRLMGKDANSRAHILSSERRKVLTRNSDDWFMIYSSKPLGVIYGIHIWHDNYGSRPEWYCDRIAVYDLTERTESVFIVEQWLALRQGDFPEAHLVSATKTDMLNIKRMFLHNSVLGFRDSHMFLSVFVRHPRSEVTRVQRISVLMCTVMVAMLCSIMFFAPEDDDDIGTDDYQYDVGMREIIISVETLVITAVLTLVVLMTFRRSYKVSYEQFPTTLQYRKDKVADALSKESLVQDPKINQALSAQDKSFYDNYVQYVSKYLKGRPLTPVNMWEDEDKVKIRKIWYTIAWSSCTIIILGAAYFVMLYGLKLGFVQSQKWLTSLVMTMGEDIFIMGPGRIIFLAILLSMAFQASTKVNVHGIAVKDAMLARPKNQLNYLNILLAKRSHPMYAPLSSSARLALQKKKEISRKWWNVLDFVNSVCFVVVLSSVIYRLWTSNFHEVHHLHNVFSESHKQEFGAVNIKQINNITLVENYLEVALIEITFDLWWYNEQLFTIGIEPEGIQKYWIEDGQHKPISSLYLHQVRVVPYDCSRSYINMTKCLLPWSLGNEDDNEYDEKWVPAMGLYMTKKNYPWEFTDRSTALWWTNQRFYGSYGTLYDVSGYDALIGPTMKEAQKTLAELRENKWQDWYTRACFMSVTVYNVNEQMFSQVTVLFEYFIDGSMFTRITVIPVSGNVLLGVWELFFFFYAIYYTGRSGYLINRMGLMDYLKTISNLTRVINVILLYMAIIIWCVHHRSSIKYFEKYMKNTEDKFFDFDRFISTFTLLQVVLSFMLCIAIVRSFILLRGGRRFLNIYYALIISFRLVFWLAFVFLLLVFICMRLQYFLYCQEYFRAKELILPHKITSYVSITLLENNSVKLFILLRVIVMYFVHALFIVFFCYYIRIAKAYKPKYSDSFNFVLFIIERVNKCLSRKKSVQL